MWSVRVYYRYEELISSALPVALELVWLASTRAFFYYALLPSLLIV